MARIKSAGLIKRSHGTRRDGTDGEREREKEGTGRRAGEGETHGRSVLGIPRTCHPDSSGIRVVGEIWRRKKEEGYARTKRETG